jgi:hypothetical protein
MFTLAELDKLDAWRFWRGVGGIWYARLPGSSPPRVKRDADLGHLQRRIVEGEPPPWQGR